MSTVSYQPKRTRLASGLGIIDPKIKQANRIRDYKSSRLALGVGEIDPKSAGAYTSATCVNFDGVDERGATYTNRFEKTDPWSLSFWYKGTPSNAPFVHDTVDGTDGWFMYSGASDKITFRIVHGGGGDIDVETSSSTSIFDGAWHHVIGTYDGSEAASGITIYLDGSSQALTTVTDTISSSILHTGDMHVAHNGAAWYNAGKIDEITVYNKELTSGEVTNIYNSGTPVNPYLLTESSASLVRWLKMGDGDTHPLVKDHSPSLRHCVLTNTESGDFAADAP